MIPAIRTDQPLSRTLRVLALLLLQSLLISCSTTHVLQPPDPANIEQALVYFMRKSYPPYVRELRLNINGKHVATIANNDFVAVSVPLGTNSILLEANGGKPFSFSMPIERAEKLFVVLTGDVKKTGQEFTGYKEFTVYLNWNLRAYRVGRSEAEAVAIEFGKRLE